MVNMAIIFLHGTRFFEQLYIASCDKHLELPCFNKFGLLVKETLFKAIVDERTQARMTDKISKVVYIL